MKLQARTFSVSYKYLSQITYLLLVVEALFSLIARDEPCPRLLSCSFRGVKSLVKRSAPLQVWYHTEQFKEHCYNLLQKVLDPDRCCADISELDSNKDIPNFQNHLDKLSHDSSDPPTCYCGHSCTQGLHQHDADAETDLKVHALVQRGVLITDLPDKQGGTVGQFRWRQ